MSCHPKFLMITDFSLKMFWKFISFGSFFCVCICSPVPQFDDARQMQDFDLQTNVQLELEDNPQCLYMKSEEGTYSYVSTGTQQVCGLYIIAMPDKKIEFEFQSFDISCMKSGMLSMVDGWELNGQFFPNPMDHPAKKIFLEFCGKSAPRRKLTASQNVGLIAFRIPLKGQGFIVNVKFVDNPKPCNVVLQEWEGTYTLRNYNRKINCSVSILFPLNIRPLATSIGMQSNWPSQRKEVETGLLPKCKKRGIRDYVEIKSGDGLDPDQMQDVIDFCGMDSIPSRRPVAVECGDKATAIRLVSSGRYENSVTFSYEFDCPLSDDF